MSESQPPPPGPEPGWEPTWDLDTGPQPSQPGRRSHRAPLGPSQRVGQLLAPLAAVGVVIIVVALLIWINGRPPGGTSSTAVAGATAPTSPTLVTPPKSHAPTPSASVTSPPSHTASPAPKPKHSKSPASHPSKSPQPPPASPTAMATVQVLNNSRIHGLAHEVAAEIANQGWQIGIIGNLQGAIPATTVFYAPGERPAAVHLAHEFTSIQQIEPNAAAHLTAKGITLVLTRFWAS